MLAQPELTCHACGKFGAYAFDGEALCADCYQARGSCCAGEFECEPPVTVATPTTAERHRLNPNCCYQACAQCRSIQRLREFQAKYPQDWESRLIGSERLIIVARQVA